MGRRGDPPGLHAAKATRSTRHPAKRGELTVKARLAEAQRVAKLLAEAPGVGGDTLSPPKFLDARFAGALAVWRQLAPKLRETHRLPQQHRLTFALFCVYFAEWVSANEDIAKHGYSQMVGTVAGGEMERIRPVVRMREIALANVMTLSKNFGLTPTDEYSLFAHQRVAAQSNAGLFDDLDQVEATSEADAGEPVEDAAPRSMIGGLGSMDGAPPGTRPN
jgi:P27 family predicted phage terminase small subunit